MTALIAALTVDWTVVILAVIAGLPATIAAVAALRQTKATHSAVNSRMDKFLADQARREKGLLDIATTAAHAAGVKESDDAKGTKQAVSAPEPMSDADAVSRLENIELHSRQTAQHTKKTAETLSEIIHDDKK